MKTPLRILCLEDNPLDAELIQATLESSGCHCQLERVETREAFSSMIDRGCFDLILVDYLLPDFDGISALALAHDRCPDVPFIFVSGTLGEEVAIECLKSGATDYVLKHRLSQLVPSVRRALDEVEQRTARLRAEAQIHFQASLLNQVRNSVVAMDGCGKILYWNECAESLFQWKAEEVIGKDLMEITPPPIAHAIVQEISSAVQKIGHWEGELEVQRKDGTTFPAYSINSTINNGHVTGVVGVSIDLTERKQLEEQLRQSQKMEAVGRLAGGVAHDFNNLLTGIIGYSQLLLQRFTDDQEVSAEIGEIEKAGKHAAALISQLLAFSRKQNLQPRLLDLNGIVADLERMLRRLIGEDIELITALDPKLFWVKADPGQLEQVILNLAINARDAMPQGGKLLIETAKVELGGDFAACEQIDLKPGPYAVLAVSDTGCGMDEATQSRVFEPFFTTKEEGTGLGLSTVYGIIKQSGGHTQVWSEPAKGTTFKIYLPRHGAVPESIVTREEARVVPGGTETVLLVEDESIVRGLATRILRDRGYSVLEAANGADALKVAGDRMEKDIHLLLTDVVMPQMSGTNLASRLRQLRPGIKVLFTSGYSDIAVSQNGVLDLESSFIQKPFTPLALAQKVREVLDGNARES